MMVQVQAATGTRFGRYVRVMPNDAPSFVIQVDLDPFLVASVFYLDQERVDAFYTRYVPTLVLREPGAYTSPQKYVFDAPHYYELLRDHFNTV